MATPPARSMPYRGRLCPFNYARMYSNLLALASQITSRYYFGTDAGPEHSVKGAIGYHEK
jgi:hypothetical protein